MAKTNAEDFVMDKQLGLFANDYKCKHCGCVFHTMISPHYIAHPECKEMKGG